MFIFSVDSFSQTFNCSGTPNRVDVCGGTYISLSFSCQLNPFTPPTGLSYVYDGINGNSIIQGVAPNSDQSFSLRVSGNPTPFFTVYIHASPSITGAISGSVCDGGSVSLSASSSAGTINWYNVSIGGTSLATGTSYSPSITSTTTYYVDATKAGQVIHAQLLQERQ